MSTDATTPLFTAEEEASVFTLTAEEFPRFLELTRQPPAATAKQWHLVTSRRLYGFYGRTMLDVALLKATDDLSVEEAFHQVMADPYGQLDAFRAAYRRLNEGPAAMSPLHTPTEWERQFYLTLQEGYPSILRISYLALHDTDPAHAALLGQIKQPYRQMLELWMSCTPSVPLSWEQADSWISAIGDKLLLHPAYPAFRKALQLLDDFFDPQQAFATRN